MQDAVRIASGHTGAVITSAGLILAGTFGSMATAPLTILFQVGVAVAIGVLIDTFLVRSILVPAITTLAGDRAWWPSGFRRSAGRACGRRARARARRGRRVPWRRGAGGGDGGCGGDRGRTRRGARRASIVRPARTSRRRLAMGLALVVMVPLIVAGPAHVVPGRLGRTTSASVRAAVVNLDEGGTMTAADGTVEDLALGADLATALTTPGDGGGFTWVAADEADAEAGPRRRAVRRRAHDPGRLLAAPSRRIRADTTGTRAAGDAAPRRPTTGPGTRWAPSPAR